MRLQVSLSLNIFNCFSYEYTGDPSDIVPGLRVVVPVGNRLATGWVTETHSQFSGKVKRVIGTIEGGAVSDRFLNYARSVSESYFVSLGSILDHSLSPYNRSLGQLFFDYQGKMKRAGAVTPKTINQLATHQPIRFFFKNTPTIVGGYGSTMIHMADSRIQRFILSYDRIDIYLEIIRSCLEKKQSVLLIVPDLLTGIYYKKLIEGSDMVHSLIKPKQRHQVWLEYGGGKSGVVIGGLLAAMLPVKNLGCVISERAGSFLYQNRSFNMYNLNHLAGLRARAFDISFVEGFSTFTSKAFAKRKQLQIEDTRESKEIQLEVRPLSAREKGVPTPLLSLMKTNYNENKKILLLVNKKKSSKFLFCRKCNKIQRCPSCSGLLNVREEGEIRCFRCGFESIQYNICPDCGNQLVNIKDMSIDSINEMVENKISEGDVVTLSADDVSGDDQTIDRIKNKAIVISTPVLISPHFKSIFDCIIYLRPETIFNMNEYNTGELIFSTISELKDLVKKGGSIYVFSIFHFHYCLKLIHQEEKFFQRELKYREWFLYPPGYNVYLLEIRSKTLRALGAEMRTIYSGFSRILNIRQIFLHSRLQERGNFKGKIEIHCDPRLVVSSGFLKKKNIRIELVAG